MIDNKVLLRSKRKIASKHSEVRLARRYLYLKIKPLALMVWTVVNWIILQG
jgi:hypothetical protein